MNCTTCGRENPPHLTFCQECGQRLGPRIAPPTPPIGLGLEPFDETAQAPPGPQPAARYVPPPVQPAVQPAPPQRVEPSRPLPQPVPVANGGPRPCRICATMNPPGLRYCTSCGSTLEPVVTAAHVAAPPRMVEPAPVAVPAGPYGGNPGPYGPPPGPPIDLGRTVADPNSASFREPQPQPPPREPAAPIAPMRVVDLGTDGPRNGAAARADSAPRMCGRCRGVVDAGAQFCKFCGAPLESAAVVSPAAGSEPLLAHERLSLPRTSVVNAVAQPEPPPSPPAPPPPAVRPPTVPMTAKELLELQGTPPASEPKLPPPPAPAPSQQAAPPAPPAVSGPEPVTVPAPIPPIPAPPAKKTVRGRLVVIAKSGADGPSYPFGDLLDVGRTEGQIIVGEDPYLSPRHVRIAWTGGKLVLRDLASTNGVYLRLVAARDAGAPTRKSGDGPVPGEVSVPLRDQDLILVGQQVLRFELTRQGSGGDAGLGPAAEHGTLLFGSPAAPRYARLSQRTVEGVTRDVYYLRKVETVLGRESGDVVFTEDPFLSRRHAAIRLLASDGSPLPHNAKPGEPADLPISASLVDLGSSNGSFLRIRADVELVPGDHFRVGQQLFRVDFDGTQLG